MREGRAIRLAAVLLLCVEPAYAADPTPGAAMLAGNCVVCHSPAADRQSKIPPLADLGVAGITAAMLAYKSDERAGSIMNRIAKGYSDTEIRLIAGYLAAHKAAAR